MKRRTFLAAGAAAGLAAGASRADEDYVGRKLPAEWKTFRDPATGRQVRQFTSARANSYPLYYFIPSITDDGRYMVLHSERSGWVQLYRMDLSDGSMVQLTAARARDSGWAIWCEPRLRGVYNHLSAIDQQAREVYYFDEEGVRAVHLETLAGRSVWRMPGRVSIGQSAVSPDGKHFAFIHTDRRNYNEVMADIAALRNMGFPRPGDWRNRIPATIGVIDTASGAYRDVIALDFHVHHVTFADNRRLVVNHVQNANGMWVVNLDGTGRRPLRPADAHGAPIHQVVTRRGIYYEAVDAEKKSGAKNWFGRYDLDTNRFEEVPLPDFDGYIHTGWDPDGRFLFFEHHGKTHELLSLHFPRVPAKSAFRKLRSMALYPVSGQRYHAHPFLSPDRRWMFYTEVMDGFSQVCALEVADLADLDEYWDRRE